MDLTKSYLMATSEIIKLIQEINGLREELSSFESLIELRNKLSPQFPALPKLETERGIIKEILLMIDDTLPWKISSENLKDEKFMIRFILNLLSLKEKEVEINEIRKKIDALNLFLKEERDNFKKIKIFSLDTKEAKIYWNLFIKFSLLVQQIKEKLNHIQKYLFSLEGSPLRMEINRIFVFV